MQAMALNPEARYPSPRALADDIERWMADEPVSALREPLTERARRWMRRHRTAATAGAIAVVMALVGLSGVCWCRSARNSDLRAANLRERARFELAMEAIQTFHSGVSEDVLLRQKEFQDLRTKLLRGREIWRSQGLLEGQADRRSRAALGKAYGELGELTSLIGSKQEALAIHRRACRCARLRPRPGPTRAKTAEVARSLIDTATARVRPATHPATEVL